MAPLSGFLHADLLGDRGGKLLYMGDHTDHPAAVRQLAKRSDHLLERALVKRSETFIDKDRIDFNSACEGRDNVGKSQCERQRREERLPARQCGRRPLLTGEMIM